jgi:hypothetical protein
VLLILLHCTLKRSYSFEVRSGILFTILDQNLIFATFDSNSIWWKLNYVPASFTRRNIRQSRLSIVDNIANFKLPLIDGAETVCTVLITLKFYLGNYR